MASLWIFVLVLIGIAAIWLIVALARQGHPEDGVDVGARSGGGPTGETYPTGSRPAGPGAEPMTNEPVTDPDR